MKAKILGMALLGAAVCLSPFAAHADSRVPGVIVGAGGGALLGQAIGRNTESTLAGAAIGGVVGMLSDMEPRYDNRVYARPFVPAPVYVQEVYWDDDCRGHHRHHNHHRHHADWRREEPRPVVVIQDRGWPGRHNGWGAQRMHDAGHWRHR